MNLNQEALAKAADALMNIQGEVLTIYFARIAITTYLTEINKTHVIMPRELPDGLDFEIPLTDGMDLWKALISEIDAREAR